MKPTLYTATGECVTPGRELGKGGEGAVYDINEFVDSVAKIYHTPPPALKQDKLAFMAATADAQLLNYVAWPQATLHGGRGGKVIGFMMPKVSGKEPIHMIYSPAHRRQRYPHCAWDFLLYVARNIASSFATVHEHGHVVGDVNQNSFMVGRDSKVVLIDSDSFQINANGTLHLCEVGVSHFTPPELQTLSSFVGFERTENHDNFGLALLIFHVLFGGRHPYSGVPLISDAGNALETDIAHFRYAYASDNQRRGLKPPPRSIPLSMLPFPVPMPGLYCSSAMTTAYIRSHMKCFPGGMPGNRWQAGSHCHKILPTSAKGAFCRLSANPMTETDWKSSQFPTEPHSM